METNATDANANANENENENKENNEKNRPRTLDGLIDGAIKESILANAILVLKFGQGYENALREAIGKLDYLTETEKKDMRNAACAAAVRKEEEARREEARIQEARIEAARIEAARIEEARREEARREEARIEAARIEAARIEAARIEAARIEEARIEEARREEARREEAKKEEERIKEMAQMKSEITQDIVGSLLEATMEVEKESERVSQQVSDCYFAENEFIKSATEFKKLVLEVKGAQELSAKLEQFFDDSDGTTVKEEKKNDNGDDGDKGDFAVKLMKNVKKKMCSVSQFMETRFPGAAGAAQQDNDNKENDNKENDNKENGDNDATTTSLLNMGSIREADTDVIKLKVGDDGNEEAIEVDFELAKRESMMISGAVVSDKSGKDDKEFTIKFGNKKLLKLVEYYFNNVAAVSKYKDPEVQKTFISMATGCGVTSIYKIGVYLGMVKFEAFIEDCLAQLFFCDILIVDARIRVSSWQNLDMKMFKNVIDGFIGIRIELMQFCTAICGSDKHEEDLDLMMECVDYANALHVEMRQFLKPVLVESFNNRMSQHQFEAGSDILCHLILFSMKLVDYKGGFEFESPLQSRLVESKYCYGYVKIVKDDLSVLVETKASKINEIKDIILKSCNENGIKYIENSLKFRNVILGPRFEMRVITNDYQCCVSRWTRYPRYITDDEKKAQSIATSFPALKETLLKMKQGK